MTAFDWWRSWHGAPMDDKWPVIAVRAGVKTGVVSAVGWALMDYASQQENRGSIEGFDTEAYAVYSGFPEEEIIKIIKAMGEIKRPIIVDNMLINWGKRQPKREDPNVNARVAQFRDRKRSVTQGNENVTDALNLNSLSISLSVNDDINGEIPGSLAPLSVACANALHVNEYNGGAEQWNSALIIMRNQGVTEEIIEKAVYKLSHSKKQYTLVGPQSILQTCLGILQERNHHQQEDNPLGLEPAPEFN